MVKVPPSAGMERTCRNPYNDSRLGAFAGAHCRRNEDYVSGGVGDEGVRICRSRFAQSTSTSIRLQCQVLADKCRDKSGETL